MFEYKGRAKTWESLGKIDKCTNSLRVRVKDGGSSRFGVVPVGVGTSGVDISVGSACLLNHDVDFVSIVHFKGLWCVVVLDALSVENKAALVVGESLALAVSFHQLLQLRGLLDLEENL